MYRSTAVIRMNQNMEVATVNAQKAILTKKFEQNVKEYLAMTTNYTTYYELDDDNFKVKANDDRIEIQFYGNQITFCRTGEVEVIIYLEGDKPDMDKVDVVMDTAKSIEEMWMMYDSVIINNKVNLI